MGWSHLRYTGLSHHYLLANIYCNHEKWCNFSHPWTWIIPQSRLKLEMEVLSSIAWEFFSSKMNIVNLTLSLSLIRFLQWLDLLLWPLYHELVSIQLVSTIADTFFSYSLLFSWYSCAAWLFAGLLGFGSSSKD